MDQRVATFVAWALEVEESKLLRKCYQRRSMIFRGSGVAVTYFEVLFIHVQRR